MKIKEFLIITLCLLAISSPVFAVEKIKIATTTSTFASIVRDIAKDKADVYSIASPNRDIHYISPTPKDVIKVKGCDVFVHAGLDLEIWRGPLLDAVGRTELMAAGDRAIDVSKGISMLEIPTSLSRAAGDIHAFGNPHYWLDPLNGKIIAKNIADGLSDVYPEEANFFKSNLGEFERKLDEKMKDWERQIAPYKGAGVVPYHNSWPYFLQRFGFVTLTHLEPKTGIPPTLRHIQEVIETMKEKNGKVIIKEVFHEGRTPKKIAKDTGAAIVTLSTETGEVKGDYASLFDENIQHLVEAFREISSPAPNKQ